MTMANVTKRVTIEAVNDRGIKFEGSWYNYSKFAKRAEIDHASPNAVADVELDKAGFVRKVRVIEGATGVTGNSQPASPAPSRALGNSQYVRLQLVPHALRVIEMMCERGHTVDATDILSHVEEILSYLEAIVLNEELTAI